MVKQNGEPDYAPDIISLTQMNRRVIPRDWPFFFSQRRYNIESLTVAPTDGPTLSRMTIQTVGDEKVLGKSKSNYTSWSMSRE